MTRRQANSFTRGIAILGLALSAVSVSTASFALDATDASASERVACTPDVFRLCSSEIPNVDRIVACLVAKRASLSPSCRSVFTKRELKAARN